MPRQMPQPMIMQQPIYQAMSTMQMLPPQPRFLMQQHPFVPRMSSMQQPIKMPTTTPSTETGGALPATIAQQLVAAGRAVRYFRSSGRKYWWHPNPTNPEDVASIFEEDLVILLRQRGYTC